MQSQSISREHRKWYHFVLRDRGDPLCLHFISFSKRTGAIQSVSVLWRKWSAPLIPLHQLRLSTWCSYIAFARLERQFNSDTKSKLFLLLQGPTPPPISPPSPCNLYVWQQHHLLASVWIIYLAIMLPLVFLQGRAPTSLGWTGYTADGVDTSQFYS